MQSTALEFGVINTLRTGNAVYDLMICMTVPAVIQAVTTSGKDSVELLRSARETLGNLLFPKTYVTHTVETSEHYGKDGKFWRPASDVRGNELLQKAILLYLSEHLDLARESGRFELLARPGAKQKLVDDHVKSLEPAKQKRILALLHHNNGATATQALPEVAKLGAYPLPMRNEWVKIGDGVEFMHEVVTTDIEKTSTVRESKVLFHFRARGRDAPDRIDAFVQRAFEFYRAAETKKFTDDTARYMYVRSHARPAATDSDDETKATAPYHKRYALGDTKTFANVFFPQKPQLLTLLDHFSNRTGKFAVHGFPNKLGLLLYGPPGTGKTSVIKAVAQYTKRHIVNISLGKIQTNQELMDAMFDLRYAVDGLDLPVRLSFKDVVFVMEDIDCASAVVSSREATGSTAAATTATTPVTKPVEVDEDAVAADADADADGDDVVADANADTEVDTDGQQQQQQQCEPMQEHEPESASSDDGCIVDDDDGVDSEDMYIDMDDAGLFGGDPSDLLAAFLQAQTGAFSVAGRGNTREFGPKAKGGFVASSNSSDKLNLAGLLNVLDGVIDCPGRIVIMTTNHPEKLDPALIRPGRISKKLHLGYMASAEICEMLAYYFSTPLSQAQIARVYASVDSVDVNATTDAGRARRRRGLSPAYIEELCAEFDTIDDVLREIETA